MQAEEKLHLIKKNIQEILGEDQLDNLIKEGKNISIYWGTMPTGSISIAYFFPMLKIADFLRAGLKVKILFADIHAALDSTPWDELEKRTAYYREAITTILKTIGAPIDQLEFVLGSDIQMTKEFSMDLLKMSTLVSIHDAKKAASEVVKLGDNPRLSGIIYPLVQALDEEYLEVDAQFGGLDQRKIMVLAREFLPKIGYKPRIEIMNPIIRGLIGEKMSSSKSNTKIDLMDTEKTIKKRINKADCVEGDPDNGVMAIVKYLIFSLKKEFKISRPEKFGGDLIYNSYQDLENDFAKKLLHPMDLKMAVANEIINLLKNFQNNKKLLDLHKEAYPDFYKN